jgi:hypothetical protein
METITLENGNEMALGTISEGTLREQDLVPAFMSTLRVVCPECWETANDEIPDAALSDDDHPWWNTAHCQDVLYEGLLDPLDEYAPEGYRFGPHEGNSSDFGYWALVSNDDDGLSVGETMTQLWEEL